MFEQTIKGSIGPGNREQVRRRNYSHSTMGMGERNGESLMELETEGQVKECPHQKLIYANTSRRKDSAKLQVPHSCNPNEE